MEAHLICRSIFASAAWSVISRLDGSSRVLDQGRDCPTVGLISQDVSLKMIVKYRSRRPAATKGEGRSRDEEEVTRTGQFRTREVKSESRDGKSTVFNGRGFVMAIDGREIDHACQTNLERGPGRRWRDIDEERSCRRPWVDGFSSLGGWVLGGS